MLNSSETSVFRITQYSELSCMTYLTVFRFVDLLLLEVVLIYVTLLEEVVINIQQD